MTAIIGGPQVVVSDEDLMRISSANPGWQIERADDGALLVSPTGTPGGAKSGEAFAQLYLFAKRAAGKTYASNTGFKTPEGGVVCPDASWVCAERVEQFRQQVGFWEMMPDVAIEVASPSDSWTTLRAKIDKFISDGAGFAIAIDPANRATYAKGSPPPGLTIDIDAIVAA